jgi:hypothetical protein
MLMPFAGPITPGTSVTAPVSRKPCTLCAQCQAKRGRLTHCQPDPKTLQKLAPGLQMRITAPHHTLDSARFNTNSLNSKETLDLAWGKDVDMEDMEDSGQMQPGRLDEES